MGKEFDFESFKAEALKQIYAGKPFTGKDGVLAPLLENLLNAALEGEMDAHLSEEERELGNRRNGRMPKQVQSYLFDYRSCSSLGSELAQQELGCRLSDCVDGCYPL